ncbi:MAG: hypothetical protein WA485_04650 [Candidatus Sulfotelmatobacter sp.]
MRNVEFLFGGRRLLAVVCLQSPAFGTNENCLDGEKIAETKPKWDSE